MSEPIQWKVQLFKLNYDEREYNAVLETLKSGWITMGQRTVDFETAYAKELGEGAQCLAVANGTARHCAPSPSSFAYAVSKSTVR